MQRMGRNCQHEAFDVSIFIHAYRSLNSFTVGEVVAEKYEKGNSGSFVLTTMIHCKQNQP